MKYVLPKTLTLIVFSLFIYIAEQPWVIMEPAPLLYSGTHMEADVGFSSIQDWQKALSDQMITKDLFAFWYKSLIANFGICYQAFRIL